MIPRLESLDPADHQAVVAHTEKMIPLLIESVGSIPLVYVTYPEGLGNIAIFHRELENGPKTIPTVPVVTSSGTHHYVQLLAHNIPWLVRGRFAVELQSWSPIPTDPQRAAFVRLSLEPQGKTTEDDIAKAAHILADLLARQHLQSIPVLDGMRGMALWIPVAGGPSYAEVSAWAHAFVDAAVNTTPDLFSIARSIADRGDRIYLGVKTNHPGMSTILPFSVRGLPHLPVACAIPWDQVGTMKNGEYRAENFSTYLEKYGNCFLKAKVAIGEQNLTTANADMDQVKAKGSALLTLFASADLGRSAHNYITQAAATILADGVVRSSDEILEAGIKAGLLPLNLPRKYVYAALHDYVARTLGLGRKPPFVQLDGNHFRINRPADTWPAIALPAFPQWIDADTQRELAARLQSTAVGEDPTAFEIAACDAIRAIGFLVEHIGGNAAPDGIATAPLGTDGYRCILECKTAAANAVVSNAKPDEPAGFRSTYHAQYAVVIGPAFKNEASLDAELQAHQVALWTVDDLIRMLQASVGPDEMRLALAPGRGADVIEDLLWQRDHGARKRIEVLVQMLAKQGWNVQMRLAGTVEAGQFPLLTRDSLLMLIDQGLVEEDVHEVASLEEFDAALAICVDRGIARKSSNGAGFVFVVPFVQKTLQLDLAS